MIEVTKVWWDGEKIMAEPVDPAIIYKEPEQPAQQEPVAWATMLGSYAHVSWGKDRPDYPIRYEVPLYTTPPAAYSEFECPRCGHCCAQRQPLTDEEIWREYRFLWPFHPEEERKLASDILMFARAIEAAHGIKENT